MRIVLSLEPGGTLLFFDHPYNIMAQIILNNLNDKLGELIRVRQYDVCVLYEARTFLNDKLPTPTFSIKLLTKTVATPVLLPIVEKNLFPDVILRFGMQRELAYELNKIKKMTSETKLAKKLEFVKSIKTMPIAINQRDANDQHYEVLLLQ